jgi:hypothetical protein
VRSIASSSSTPTRRFASGRSSTLSTCPKGASAPTLKRLEGHGLVEHRDQFWTIADAGHAVASAGLHGAATADDIDGGFSDGDVEAWMETAVDPIESETEQEEP